MPMFLRLTLKQHLYDANVACKYPIKSFFFLIIFYRTNRREKRTLEVLILIVVRYKFARTCSNGPCAEHVRTRVQKQIEKIGNIPNCPCQVLSVGVLHTFTLTSAMFLGFQPASK